MDESKKLENSEVSKTLEESLTEIAYQLKRTADILENKNDKT